MDKSIVIPTISSFLFSNGNAGWLQHNYFNFCIAKRRRVRVIFAFYLQPKLIAAGRDKGQQLDFSSLHSCIKYYTSQQVWKAVKFPWWEIKRIQFSGGCQVFIHLPFKNFAGCKAKFSQQKFRGQILSDPSSAGSQVVMVISSLFLYTCTNILQTTKQPVD